MRKRVLIMIAGCFYYSGLVALARWWTRHSGRHVVILNYHTASGGQLLRHILYLRRHYYIQPIEIALEELFASASSNASVRADRRIPLVLTFDDGYVDNFTYAMEMARNYCVPISIYLIPDYVTTGKRFWWFEGQSMARRAHASEVMLDRQVLRLHADNAARGVLAQYVDDHARHATSVTERETFLSDLREKLELSLQPDERDRDWERLPVNWEQVLAMDNSGWISFGAHTMHHPILSYLTDPIEIQDEVTTCRQVLEQRLGHPIRTFAYPVGQAQHMDDDVVQAVKHAGYSWALTTTYGLNTPASDPYRLKRIETDVTQHWLIVAVEAAGLWGFFSRLRWLPFIRKNFTNASSKKGI